LYGPVNYAAFSECLTQLLSTPYFLSEVSLRTVLHDNAERIAVCEASLIRKNIGVIELTQRRRFLLVVVV